VHFSLVSNFTHTRVVMTLSVGCVEEVIDRQLSYSIE